MGLSSAITGFLQLGDRKGTKVRIHGDLQITCRHACSFPLPARALATEPRLCSSLCSASLLSEWTGSLLKGASFERIGNCFHLRKKNIRGSPTQAPVKMIIPSGGQKHLSSSIPLSRGCVLYKHERTKKHAEPGKGDETWRDSRTRAHSIGFYQSFATVAAYADSTAPAMLNESDIASLLGVIISEERLSMSPQPLSLHTAVS